MTSVLCDQVSTDNRINLIGIQDPSRVVKIYHCGDRHSPVVSINETVF